MKKIFRVLGPPGTGKTTYVVDQANKAADKYGIDGVRVVSMTKTASLEFARRKSAIPGENISTLHALAYRSILKPGMLNKKDLDAWNGEHPGFMLSSFDDPSTEAEYATNDVGDELLGQYNLRRARLQPIEKASEKLRAFAIAYDDFRQETGRIDFTDMLENALHETEEMPGRPNVLFVDEAQDLSALELALVEKWSARCDSVVMVGDPDQSLYTFRGADKEVMLPEDGTPPHKILTESYRVPRRVHARAMRTIQGGSTWSGATYNPKDEEGSVFKHPDGFDSPIAILDHYEKFALSDPFNANSMFLSSSGYMLGGLLIEMKRRNIGYHNPYRREWNPLATGVKGKVTGADRLLACARLGSPTANPMDWRMVLSGLRSEARGGPIRYGAGSLYERLDPRSTGKDLSEVLALMLTSGGWALFDYAGQRLPTHEELMEISGASTKEVRESMRFPISVYYRDGLKGVAEPKTIVGTIHSVKGGEADTVYLDCQLSRSACKDRSVPGWAGWDSIQRLYYVGITRAKSKLVTCFSGRVGGVAIL